MTYDQPEYYRVKKNLSILIRLQQRLPYHNQEEKCNDTSDYHLITPDI